MPTNAHRSRQTTDSPRPARPRPPDGRHVVAPGEWLSKIAWSYGFTDWERVWNANRERIPDPNIIRPGETVFIPERTARTETCETDRVHRFVLGPSVTSMRVVLLDWRGEPRRDVPYLAEIDGEVCHPDEPDTMGFARTNDRGEVTIEFPEGAERGTLLIAEDWSSPEVITLLLGHLDPIRDLRGCQQRLANLGYYAGSIDGLDGPLTRAALGDFQRDENQRAGSARLAVDGCMNEETLDALRQRHGC